MITVTEATSEDFCTECGREIGGDGDPAIYIEGYGYGSRRYEVIMCGSCTDAFIDDLKRERDRQISPIVELKHRGHAYDQEA